MASNSQPSIGVTAKVNGVDLGTLTKNPPKIPVKLELASGARDEWKEKLKQQPVITPIKLQLTKKTISDLETSIENINLQPVYVKINATALTEMRNDIKDAVVNGVQDAVNALPQSVKQVITTAKQSAKSVTTSTTQQAAANIGTQNVSTGTSQSGTAQPKTTTIGQQTIINHTPSAPQLLSQPVTSQLVMQSMKYFNELAKQLAKLNAQLEPAIRQAMLSDFKDRELIKSKIREDEFNFKLTDPTTVQNRLDYFKKEEDIRSEARMRELDKKHEYRLDEIKYREDVELARKKEYYDYRQEAKTAGTWPRFFSDLKDTIKESIVHYSPTTKLNPDGTSTNITKKSKLDFKKLLSGLKSVFTSDSTKALGKNLLLGLAMKIVSGLLSLLKMAFNLYKQLVKAVVSALFVPAKKLANVFKSILKSAMKHSQIIQAIERIIDSPLIILFEYLFIPLLKVIIPTITKVIKFISENKDAITRWGEVLASFVDTTILQPLLNGLNNDLLNNPFAGAFNIMSSMLEAMIGWVRDNSDTIGKLAEETIFAISDYLVNSATLAGEILSILATALENAVNGDLMDKLIGPLTSIVVSIINIISRIISTPEVMGALLNCALTIVGAFFNFLGSAIVGVFSSIAENPYTPAVLSAIGAGIATALAPATGGASLLAAAPLGAYSAAAWYEADQKAAQQNTYNTQYITQNYGDSSKMTNIDSAGAVLR